MMGIIVSQMPLGEDETERAWIFGDAEFAMMIEALFRPLRNETASPEGKQRIRDRYGTGGHVQNPEPQRQDDVSSAGQDGIYDL